MLNYPTKKAINEPNVPSTGGKVFDKLDFEYLMEL